MIVGLANTLPTAMSTGLQEQGVSATVAHKVANLPPVGTLFAAFLGYNPIEELLAPYHALHQPGVNADALTSETFFPHLIVQPFHSGLVVVFVAAALMMAIGMLHRSSIRDGTLALQSSGIRDTSRLCSRSAARRQRA